MLIEVPAHVQHDNHIQNAIQVQGGTNWDLSRSAVATPISPLPDPVPQRIDEGRIDAPEALKRARALYEPQHNMPEGAPAAIVRFARGAAIVPAAAQRDIKALGRGAHLIVAGHADAGEKGGESLARKRAEAVAKRLRQQGATVEAVRSFGTSVPATHGSTRSDANRRVEVFVP